MKKTVTVSAQIDEELHLECRKRLLDDKKSLRDLIRAAMRQYANGQFKIE